MFLVVVHHSNVLDLRGAAWIDVVLHAGPDVGKGGACTKGGRVDGPPVDAGMQFLQLNQ